MKILVIEDNKEVLEVLRTMLEDAGHETIPANDGTEGVRAFRACKPDLVITDIIMPERDGIETMREIRALDPDAKIVALSGGAMIGKDYYLHIADALGATALLSKPFTPNDLHGAINACLRDEPAGASQ
jgi:CheY-like chemotaxis protein